MRGAISFDGQKDRAWLGVAGWLGAATENRDSETADQVHAGCGRQMTLGEGRNTAMLGECILSGGGLVVAGRCRCHVGRTRTFTPYPWPGAMEARARKCPLPCPLFSSAVCPGCPPRAAVSISELRAERRVESWTGWHVSVMGCRSMPLSDRRMLLVPAFGSRRAKAIWRPRRAAGASWRDWRCQVASRFEMRLRKCGLCWSR